MIKIAALNEESEEEESEVEGEVTREALEEIAMQQYAKTLELQRKGNTKEALQLLKDLLDTELLDGVKKPEENEHVAGPLLNLKYLCFRNIALISAQLGDEQEAVEAYLEASNLDPTDITLWYRLGTISLKLKKFDLALYAFQRGVECNPKHWPCLDNLITLLLGLGEYNECISTIYHALNIDQDYLRGRVYRKHIFTDYPYVHDYLSLINPLYKWDPQIDIDVVGDNCDQLLLEAKKINDTFTQQILETKVEERLPVLSLNKPIENLTWLSVGESIVDMHMHISEKLLSHACVIKVTQPEEKVISGILSEETVEDNKVDVKINGTENIHVDKEPVEKVQDEKVEKTGGNESEKMETDQEIVAQVQEIAKPNGEAKETRKASTRRRGSSVSFLKQWEWCNKRKSSRKKANKPEPNETICDIIKGYLPEYLRAEEIKSEQKQNKEFKADDSLDTMDLYKLFEEREKGAAELNAQCDKSEGQYFNTEKEQTDVQEFIQKYVDSTCDIITMVDEFVLILSKYWDVSWPDGLGDIYMEANWCSRQHSDPPLGYVNPEGVLKTFININIMHLEISINKLLEEEEGQNGNVENELIDLLKMLCARREELGDDAFTLTIRYLWVKCHSLLYKGQVEFALDCLYYLLYEFNCLDEEGNSFLLKVPNFSKCPMISKGVCIELIKSLERNKRLSTVPGLYDAGKYEDVLSILQDSFKYCQLQASKQEWASMSLDWAVQLVMLMESFWAMNDTEQCLTWATLCLHESLKQYNVCEQGTDDQEKWSMTVVKALLCIEHVLKTEGSSYLDVLPEKTLTRLIQDIIQIVGHQLDDLNTSQELPFNTVVCWILLHFVFQREEDCGRIKTKTSLEESADNEIPASLMVLFLAHENLGKKGWCAVGDGQLLYFTLKTVISRLRSPALNSVIECVSQYLEQCVFCLFGHPTKKTKIRFLIDHNATPHKLDWDWAQQIFDLYRPEEMPEFNSYRLGSITADTEQLFQRMLSLAPSGLDPQPYYADVIAFIEGKKSKLVDTSIEIPYKMRDIYYLLADFYLKNNETVKALKYYTYDLVINSKRFDSWAGMALARGSLLETKLNSCESFRTETEYLNRATAVECCFKQALQIDSSHSMLWIEYGAFVYGVHSFCSRMLKQASESLSMESFEVLENKKESMLNTASRCFVNAHKQWMAEYQGDDKGPQDERWLHYYMLGKISEKKNEAPQKYLEYYQKAGKFLQENNATYPTKINYNNPQNLSVEALEIHYRIHASILKYIEQHENKVIYKVVGSCFKEVLDLCNSGPFSVKKKLSKDMTAEKESAEDAKDTKTSTDNVKESNGDQEGAVKRNHSEISENDETDTKKPKLVTVESNEKDDKEKGKPDVSQSEKDVPVETGEKESEIIMDVSNTEQKAPEKIVENVNEEIKTVETEVKDAVKHEDSSKVMETEPVSTPAITTENNINNEAVVTETNVNKLPKDSETASNTATSKDNTSSDSSSDSSSSDSSSSSSSSSTDDSGKDKQENAEMTQAEISDVITICLQNLEDCVSRFPQHYKALYRLAHFHFYYKKDKNVSRCKDLMLGNFISKSGVKLQGLFCERKNSNFFNSIWRIPASEVDRPGSFASHMSRCILITMEILKDSNDYKMLLELSLHLQRTPDPEKKYLRDSERIELYQQALSLCVRSIKMEISKISKLSNLITTEKQKISNFMLDIYKAYQRLQKHIPVKSQTFSSLLLECYRLYTGKQNSENALDKCLKKCQSIIVQMKQQAQAASNPPPPPPTPVEPAPAPAPPVAPPPVSVPKKSKPYVPIIPATSFLPHVETPISYPNLSNPYLPYLPMMDHNFFSALSNFDQAAAALYMSNMAGMGPGSAAGYPSDFVRQIMSSSFETPYMQSNKPKYNQSILSTKTKSSAAAALKTNTTKSSIQAVITKPTTAKSSTATKTTVSSTATKNTPTSSASNKSYTSYTSLQPSKKTETAKSTFVPTPTTPTTPTTSFYSASNNVLPAHTSRVTPSPTGGSAQPAHQSSTSTVSAALQTKPPGPHQQVSPGKTLQEKLAERQKQNPSVSKPVTDSSAHSSPSSAFSGKIPSSLTITKTPSSKVDEAQSKSRDVRKSMQFVNQPEKLAQPKKVIDSSEVIVLDDD